MRKLELSVVSVLLSIFSCCAFSQASLTIRPGKSETVTGRPFTAEESVHLVQQLANGVTLRHEMTGHVYRAGNGTLRFEGTETNTASGQPVTLVWVVDPVKRTATNWNTNSKIAYVSEIPAGDAVTVGLLPQPRIPGETSKTFQGSAVATTDLGHHTEDQLDLIGERVVTTIPIGKVGNEEPIELSTETWKSAELMLSIKEIDLDPRTGTRTMEMTHITRTEPDAALFEIPAGYTLKERPGIGSLAHLQTPPPVPDLQTQQIAAARKDSGPVLKNDVAYKLAMEKIDLPDAQSLAEQAVQIAEQRTAGLNPKNAESFTEMDSLSRYWNTLGWVYFRQGDLTRAEAFTRAAWELSPQGYFGAHLGRIYEEQNRPKEAITIYRMALSARESTKQADQIRSRLADLGVPKPEPLPVAAPIPLSLPHARPQDTGVETLLEVVISHANPPEVVLLKGSPRVAKMADIAIRQNAAAFLPDSGPERIVRRATVTCDEHHVCTLRFLTPDEARAAAASLSN